MIKAGPESMGEGTFQTPVLFYQTARRHILKVIGAIWKLNRALRTNDG